MPLQPPLPTLLFYVVFSSNTTTIQKLLISTAVSFFVFSSRLHICPSLPLLTLRNPSNRAKADYAVIYNYIETLCCKIFTLKYFCTTSTLRKFFNTRNFQGENCTQRKFISSKTNRYDIVPLSALTEK